MCGRTLSNATGNPREGLPFLAILSRAPSGEQKTLQIPLFQPFHIFPQEVDEAFLLLIGIRRIV